MTTTHDNRPDRSGDDLPREELDTGANAAVPGSAGYADHNGVPDQGEMDLAERRALRRVPGLSTELTDVHEVEVRSLRLEHVVLIGVWTSGTQVDADNSLHELKQLAETAGALVLEGATQRRNKPDPATYVGRGKARELREIAESTGADTVICDGELAPGQLRQLEDVVKVKVIDRTALILDIFAQHARSREGRTQVELAQLSYLLPRLRGWGDTLSRQAGGRAGGGNGGVGLRGPGETKIETDRRRINTRMSKLRRELAQMATARDVKRDTRRVRQVPAVAIAGYTNAGKSSLLNRLTGAGVLVEDELFATLDPTVRQARTPDGRAFTFSDTVGFVRHLPHQLVEAFRSTLEEVTDSDLILHVVDAAHPDPEQQLAAVREVFGEIEAQDVPEIVVLNKVDAADPVVLRQLRTKEPGAVEVSARTGAGIEELIETLSGALPSLDREVRVMLPYERGDLVSRVHDEGRVVEEEHTGSGTALHAWVPEMLAGKLDEYAVTVR
ncbi:GTP-binding protein HflX [Lipingzhangella halophila]|uniref:GTPase HflX n=1 Tax=Lipingzhangella halophila TaxID=1783352 RepID=A0A7W7RE08_9ACTN|nr:GTPase HflX [Lipingzhangella halophila]MBB4930277.1 GTP-binding protein HflX [Lipingzhangella halophila]